MAPGTRSTTRPVNEAPAGIDTSSDGPGPVAPPTSNPEVSPQAIYELLMDLQARLKRTEERLQQSEAKNEVLRSEVHRQGQGRSPTPPTVETASTANTPRSAFGKGPNVAPPPRFDGSSTAIRQFIRQCEINFTLRPDRFYTEEQKVHWAASYLDGAAQSWYLGVWEADEASPTLASFLAFKEALQGMFGDPYQRERYEEEILTLRQTTTAAAYAVKFDNLLPYQDWPESTKKRMFFRGLKRGIRDKILPDAYTRMSYAELRAQAVAIDNRFQAEQSPSFRATASSDSSGSKNRAQKGSSNWFFSSSKSSTVARDPYGDTKVNGITAKQREERIKSGLCKWCGAKWSREHPRECSNKPSGKDSKAAAEAKE